MARIRDKINQGLITPEGHLKDLLDAPQRQVLDEDLSVCTPCHPEYLQQLQVHKGKIFAKCTASEYKY